MRNILPLWLFSFSYSSCCRTSSRSFFPKESRSLSSSTDSSSLFSLSSSSTGRASYKSKKVLTFKSYMCTNPPLFFLTKDFNFSLGNVSIYLNLFHVIFNVFYGSCFWIFYETTDLMEWCVTVPPVKCLRTSWPPGAPPYCIVYELLVRPVHHAVEDLSFLLVQAFS